MASTPYLNLAIYSAGGGGDGRMPISTALRTLHARFGNRVMSPPIGVFIVSPNRLFADALASLLANREELAITGKASDPEGFAGGSDVLLIDGTGNAGGVSASLTRLRNFRGRSAGCKVIVMGLPGEDERLIDFIEAGAQGYVLRGASPAGLVEAIRAAQAGRSCCSAWVVAAVVARILDLERRETRVDRREREPLTARELEVLGLMATGRGNKEIGRRLRISVQTVKNHAHSILAKLGAGRRREALRIAYEIGLLGVGGEPRPADERPGNGNGRLTTSPATKHRSGS
jgi:DNA-binding NarL/FixJ family response regulator